MKNTSKLTVTLQNKITLVYTVTLHWTQMANGHFRLDLNGRQPSRLVSNGQWWTFETIDVTWSQKSTLVYTLNLELICRSVITDVQMYRFAKVTIYF